MSEINAVTFEVIRNRLVLISDEMRIALQAVSGSPTVTEASDFFTGLFLPDGSIVSMGFQVSFQAPVCGQVIRHINGKPQLKVRDGDIFIGNDPYIGALHQNDVQMIGPIYAGGEIIPGPASRRTRPTSAAWISRAGARRRAKCIRKASVSPA